MISMGFPRMHKEKEERRDFTPNFFSSLLNEDVNIFMEEDYGIGMGFTKEDYIKANKKIKFVKNNECYKKDVIIVLRSPEYSEINEMRRGSSLISMLHYPTRPVRVKLLKEKNINGISLDGIRNDSMERIIVNYSATSKNGVRIAFKELEKSMIDFYSRDRGPIIVSIIGAGMVAAFAARAASKFGDHDILHKIHQVGAKGVEVKILSRMITSDKIEMKRILGETDILIDASSRDDSTKYIINNEQIAYLKNHSIILDLSADPYLTDITPIRVKGIEGIPTGNIDKMIFYPNDKEYQNIPAGVNSSNRRIVVSCSSWPGIRPKECMELYGIQLIPIVKTLIKNGWDNLSIDSDNFFIRAAYRGTVEHFEGENPLK